MVHITNSTAIDGSVLRVINWIVHHPDNGLDVVNALIKAVSEEINSKVEFKSKKVQPDGGVIISLSTSSTFSGVVKTIEAITHALKNTQYTLLVDTITK